MKIKALDQEFLEVKYQVKLSKNGVIFIWGSTPKTPLKSSIDLKVRMDPEELLSIAKKFNISVEGNRILVHNLESYNRLLIYACTRPTLGRNVESVRKLKDLVFNITSWDAHYWASAFRELWWKHGKRASLQKTIKAFKIFFGIDS